MTRNATYADVQELKEQLAETIAAWQGRFANRPDIKLAFKVGLVGPRGTEEIKVDLKEIDPYVQGEFGIDDVEAAKLKPVRSFARN